MVKHCHEESSGNLEIAQGALLGLVVENRLEITNCFPFPKHNDDSIDEEEYQLAMMRRLRRVNVDHFHVGWYQSSDVGNFLSLPLLESQYHYQTSIEESVVVIYGEYCVSSDGMTDYKWIILFRRYSEVSEWVSNTKGIPSHSPGNHNV